MTTHPPGHPTGPTGPGRTDTPGPADAAFRPSDGPGANPIGALPVDCTCGHGGLDRMFHLAPCPLAERGDRLPRLDEQVRNAQDLIAQAEAVLRRDVDPASEPTVMAWPALTVDVLVHRLLLAEVAEQLYFVQRKLGRIAALPMPPVGSAVDVVGPSAMDSAAFAKQVAAAMKRNAEGRP